MAYREPAGPARAVWKRACDASQVEPKGLSKGSGRKIFFQSSQEAFNAIIGLAGQWSQVTHKSSLMGEDQKEDPTSRRGEWPASSSSFKHAGTWVVSAARVGASAAWLVIPTQPQAPVRSGYDSEVSEHRLCSRDRKGTSPTQSGAWLSTDKPLPVFTGWAGPQVETQLPRSPSDFASICNTKMDAKQLYSGLVCWKKLKSSGE